MTSSRKQTKQKASKLPKPKIWSLKKADEKFSLVVRQRDGRCLFPGCTVRELSALQCSHYIGRQHRATRFDSENCVALCWKHHFNDKLLGFEYQKQLKELHGYDGQYTKFMRKLLGPKRFKELLARGRSTVPQSTAIVRLMVELS